MTLQCLPDGSQNPAWVAERRGKLGGSKIDDALKVGARGGRSKTRDKLIACLVAERLTGIACNYVNPSWDDIARGLEHEPLALSEYESRHGVMLEPAAWVEHPTIEFAGSTPDSFIGREGLTQVKCPRLDNFIAIMIGGEIPEPVQYQMQWEMACCPWTKWNDYSAYNDQMPEGKKLWVKRLERDQEIIERLEDEAKKLLGEVEDIFKSLSEREFE